jgi:hypothetical protein
VQRPPDLVTGQCGIGFPGPLPYPVLIEEYNGVDLVVVSGDLFEKGLCDLCRGDLAFADRACEPGRGLKDQFIHRILSL